MTTGAYEALDRTLCAINNIEVNLVEHSFYDENEEYRKLIDSTVKALFQANRVAAWEMAK